MKVLQKTRTAPAPRIALTDQLWRKIGEEYRTASVSDVARRKGLPYLLVYNIFHKRVKSISAIHYRILLKKEPPLQTPDRTDGTYFRQLVALWLFLNDDVSKALLYREFFGSQKAKKVDYRLFSGKIRSVDPGLVKHMQGKFFDQGIQVNTVQRWIYELALQEEEKPVEYNQIKPILDSLKASLGVPPSILLHQSVKRYEAGDLRKVSPKIYSQVVELAQKVQHAQASGLPLEIKKLKEEIYGAKRGYTLYAQVEEELQFLKQFAGISVREYLGRSISTYSQGHCKRLPAWRAQKILQDCRAFVRQADHLPLSSLPHSAINSIVNSLTTLLKARIADQLSRIEGLRLEKQILKPSYSGDEYRKKIHGFTRFDLARKTLHMKKKAFDLMVAANCEIFRKVGTFAEGWYLSDLYLHEVSQKQYFDVIAAKYEWLSNTPTHSRQINTCGLTA